MNPLEMAIDDTPGRQVDIAECEVETVSDVADVPEVEDVPDFCDIIGQEHAKRALEVAAAGGHSVLMVGPPGMGKTLLRAALPGIIPAKYRGKYQASAYESWVCPCGYYGDTAHKCIC